MPFPEEAMKWEIHCFHFFLLSMSFEHNSKKEKKFFLFRAVVLNKVVWKKKKKEPGKKLHYASHFDYFISSTTFLRKITQS